MFLLFFGTGNDTLQLINLIPAQHTQLVGLSIKERSVRSKLPSKIINSSTASSCLYCTLSRDSTDTLKNYAARVALAVSDSTYLLLLSPGI
jgi:hypothetical protein